MDRTVDLPGLGRVRYDLAFGGAFYAFVPAEDLGLSIEPSSISRLIDAGRAIKRVLIDSGPTITRSSPGSLSLRGFRRST